MTIGSVIGTLRINGNPDADLGDINLSLREKGSAVEIATGTKNLVLITPLDKEGITGPSSVYVNVICDRRHSSDPVSRCFVRFLFLQNIVVVCIIKCKPMSVYFLDIFSNTFL